MISALFSYLAELFGFARRKIIGDFILTVLLGLLEGVSILMLLPLLSMAGISPESQSGAVRQIAQFLGGMRIKLSLPLVLAAYTGIIALQSWLQRYEAILNVTIREMFDSYLNTSLYRSLTYAKWSFFLTVKKADLTHVVTAELMRVSSGTYYFLRVTALGLISAIEVAVAFAIAPLLTLLVIGCGLLLFWGMRRFVRESRHMGMNISEFTGSLYSEVTEHFGGIKEVKSYGLERLQVQNFENRRCRVEKTFIDFVKIQSQTDLLYKIGAAVLVSVFCYTALAVLHLNAQVFLVVVFIFARLWPRFSAFQAGLQEVVMMLPAFQAVDELRHQCRAAEETATPAGKAPLPIRKGLTVENVSFRFHTQNEHYALQQISLYLPAGTTTALTGVSGAGKSTLADMITGLILPEEGRVLIDGIPLDYQNVGAWRQSIGYVPQDAFLFNATIRENLRWACQNAGEAEIWEALQLAAIDNFVRGLPDRLDTVVGDRGIRLSGGERQRIVLARALLRKPDLLILDEATSALDLENERSIQSAIDGLRGKLTILMIAHRLSTIRNADLIIVMEKGRIVEQGTYASFLADPNSRFYKLAML